MEVIGLPEIVTLMIGLLTLMMGEFLTSRSEFLTRLNIPAAVVGGLLTSVIVSIIEANSQVTINFAPHLRDILILVFFVTLGLTAKVRSLFSGGWPLVWVILVTILLLCVQNIIGILVQVVRGGHPFYGLLAGSISFVGGPGTALAWAKEAESMGLKNAELVAISAATFAVSIGALISGPVTTWIVTRHGLKSTASRGGDGTVKSASSEMPTPASTSTLVRTIFLITLSIWLGNLLNSYSKSYVLLPGFLCSLIAGMVITNLADLRGRKLPLPVTDKVGDLALQIFLAMSLMSLKLASIGAFIGPLLTVVALQVIFSILIAYYILFRALGKDYDAAVAVGGFLGYAVSSMPVAMATMEQVTKKFGPAPKAILLITLVGSFFVDLINAFLVKGFVAILPFIPGGGPQ